MFRAAMLLVPLLAACGDSTPVKADASLGADAPIAVDAPALADARPSDAPGTPDGEPVLDAAPSWDAATALLAVTVEGTGGGTVTSAPAGIFCTAGSCLANFPIGTTVTLTAEAAKSATFAGWAGACTGAAPTCEPGSDREVRHRDRMTPWSRS